MKIYEIQYSCGEKEWIAANTVIEALIISHGFSEMDICDLEREDDIVIFPEEKWSDAWVTDPDNLDDDGDETKLYTFKEWMDKNNVPDLIAMTSH